MRCGCGRSAVLPLRRLIHRHGAAARLPALIARMRCEGCGGRPVEATLLNNPQWGAPGYVGSGIRDEQPVPLPDGGEAAGEAPRSSRTEPM